MRVPMSKIHVWPLLKQTASEWSEDKAPKMAASLAYYTATSIAPLVVAVLGIGTLVARNKFTPKQIHDTLAGFTDPHVADVLNDTLNSPSAGHAGLLATILGVVVALFSASGVFGELQDSLNTVWEVRPKPNRGIWGVIHDRFLTLSMVAGIAFLLLVSTVLTSVITGLSGATFGRLFGGHVSSGVAKDVFSVVTFFVTTGIVTVLFAAIFKVLPDVVVAWRDVWLGAFLTALLFQVGKFGLSFYLGRAAGSAFGALGAIVIALVWVYYSAQILFFGAEFTQVYANQYGSHVVPAANAEPLTEDMRKQAGVPHAEGSASHPDRKPAPAKRPVARPVVRYDVAAPTPAVSTPGTRTRGAVLMAAAPVAVGVVLGRFAFLRYKAGRVHTADIHAGWHTAADQWKKVAKLFVSKSADRFAMMHGPTGRTRGGRTSWADLAGKFKGR